MEAYTKPKWKKEESEGLRGERVKIESIGLDFKYGSLQDSGKEEGKTFHKLQVLGVNDDLWDGIRRLWYNYRYIHLKRLQPCRDG